MSSAVDLKLNTFFPLLLNTTYTYNSKSHMLTLSLDPSGYPFIWVLRQSVPVSGINGLTILLLIIVIVSNISFNASTSRQTYAFARDNVS